MPANKTKKTNLQKELDALKAKEKRAATAKARAIAKAKANMFSFRVDVPGFFTDGLLAIDDALHEVFGDRLTILPKYVIEGPFGSMEQSTTFLEIETSRGVTRSVPYGVYRVEGLGQLQNHIGYDQEFDFPTAIVTGEVPLDKKAEFQRFVDTAKLFAQRDSIYKGQAFRVHWPVNDMNHDESWSRTKPVTFMDLTGVDPADLILTTTAHRHFEQAVLTPMRHTLACRLAKIPLKRGTLLSGPPGVGKTMMANVIAQTAEANQWTFIYLDNVSQLAKCYRFAARYAPAVIFCEDVDRVVTGERTTSIDEILNNLDGVDTKSAEVMVVLTTNDEKAIRLEALRPGRVDAIIRVTLPDAEAAERLVRRYARQVMSPEENLGALPKHLANNPASAVREVVERAKLACIAAGEDVWLTAEKLQQAADDVVSAKPLSNGHAPTLIPPPLRRPSDLD